MAWIESHQTLASHPKTRKAARSLGVPAVHLIGHLHCLWHWALDLAEDGDLTKFDVDDLAIAAQWDGDAETFVNALLDCGFGDGPGFLERDGSYGDPQDNLTGDLVLHDWWSYAGKLVARRQQDRKRKAARRSAERPDPVPQTSDGHPEDVQGSAGTREPDPTEPDRTPPDTTTASDVPPDGGEPSVSDDARQLTRQFAIAVKANGHPVPAPDRKAHADWLVEMDRLLRIGPPGWDGQPPSVDEIRTVIRYATVDEFERANVQSVPKLRKRYSQLRLKALNTGPARASPGSKGGQYAARYRQAAAELERQGR